MAQSVRSVFGTFLVPESIPVPVKLAFTSDLHLPTTPRDVIAELARQIAGFAPDAVAVAGDIGESLADIQECLCIIKQAVTCPVLVVAGNHDLWSQEYRKNTKRRWRDELPEIVGKADCIWLEGESHIIQGVALAGSIAWYDYSAADPRFSELPAETFASNKRYYNPDAVLIEWSYSDPEFARLVGESEVRQTIVFTHVPLLECQMCRKPQDEQWGFTNAYFGNLTLGEQVIQRKKVTHIISGHTRVGRHALVKLTDGRTIEARVLESHYGKPVWHRLIVD
jgi:Calcineurin-like phosphoesterase